MAKLTLFHFTQELMSLVSVELVYYLSIILHIFKIYKSDSSKNEPLRQFRLKKPVDIINYAIEKNIIFLSMTSNFDFDKSLSYSLGYYVCMWMYLYVRAGASTHSKEHYQLNKYDTI